MVFISAKGLYMKNENLYDFASEVSFTKHPLKNPLVIAGVSMIFGILIGASLACIGIQKINFVLFCAIFAGMIYSSFFKEVIPFSIRLKAGWCYYLFAFILSCFITIAAPGAIPIMTNHTVIFLFGILPCEAVLFIALLHLGSVIQLKSFSPRQI